MSSGSSILLSCLDLLVLKAWHRQQVLEEEVQEDQCVELQVAVGVLLK